MRDERRAVDALVERLVRESNLPNARAREELRRELTSHFEEAGTSPEAIRAALERFGSADVVTDGFRRAYRRGRVALYAAKVLASILLATTAALALQVIANLRVGGAAGVPVRLGPGYLISVCFSFFIVVVLVAAWELDVEPLCARLERRPLRLLAVFAALFATIYVGHPLIHRPMDLGPTHLGLMVVGSSASAAVWACTIAILARLDLAFLRLLGPRDG